MSTSCAASMFKYSLITCTCIPMYTRAWKNHLAGVAKDNQLQIYHTLCILLNEVDKTQFHSHMTQFVNYWEDKEPHFVHYFNTYYKGRASETINNKYL